MNIPSLIDQYIEALRNAGVKSPFADWAQFDAATDDDLDALEAACGCSLQAGLGPWLRHVTCALPFQGNYTAVSISSILERIESTKTIDFSKHLANIHSWNDGRFENNKIEKTYWQPQWIGVARDGCGNEYCVDLAPGPGGEIGQILAMEFQDGQGPYLGQWPNLEGMLQAHIARLEGGDFTLDEEGFIEFE